MVLVFSIPWFSNNLNITDLTADETKPINARDRIFAAHILCAKKDEEAVNAALGNTYCKVRKASWAVGEYPEGRNMQYVPIKMTGNIAHTPKWFRKLQKNRITHKWSQERHHPIPFIGFSNIYQVLIAPNGDWFTLCQVIMSIKCRDYFISPMFIAVNISHTGDVVITCDIDMKSEAEALLSHFGIYLALIFGSVVWEAFTARYKMKMDAFQFCHIKQCAVELDSLTIDSTKSTDLDFTKIEFSEDLLILPNEILFNPKNQFTLHVCLDVNGLHGNENGDSGTIRSNWSDATLGTFKTAPSEPLNYLIPRSITTSVLSTAPTTISNDNNNSKDDAPMLQSPVSTTSTEVALSSRSEGSGNN